MKLLLRLLALFLILPIVELALLVQVDRLIGFWPTIGLIAATGLAGGILAKREGLSVWRRFNERMAEGALPGQEVVEGVIILISGALLITPGVLTDVLGFIGLVPFTRAALRKIALHRIQRAVQSGRVAVNVQGSNVRNPWASSTAQAAPPGWQGTPHDLPRHHDAPRPPNPRPPA